MLQIGGYSLSFFINGGTAFLVHDSCQILSSSSPVFKSFEISIVTLKLSKSRLTVFNVYRPPPSSTKAVPFSQFLFDFQTLVSLAATTSYEFLITGDSTFMLMIIKILRQINFYLS